MTTADSGIIDKAENRRKVVRITTEFPFFLQELWKDRKLNQKAPLDRIELDMADWIQNGPQYRGLLGFRGAGKSYFGTTAFACFRLLQDPDRKVLVVSNKIQVMREVVTFAREWIERTWFLEHLRPVAKRKGSTDTLVEFDVEPAQEHKQPSLKACSVGAALESNRAHTILGDDLETKTNTKTFDARENLGMMVQEFIHILYPDLSQIDPDEPDIIPVKHRPEVCVFGTVKHEQNVYLKLADQGYEFRTYPIVYPTPDEVKGALGMAPILLEDMKRGHAIYLGKEHPTAPGCPTIPRRFNASECDKRRYGVLDPATGRRKGGITLSQWLMEYQLQVNLAAAMPFKLKLKDLMVMSVDRDTAPVHLVHGTRDEKESTALDIESMGHGDDKLYRPAWIDTRRALYTGTKAYIDPAGRGEDKVGVAVIGHLGGFFHVKCLRGLDGGYDAATCETIADLMRKHGVREVYCERNFGGGMFDVLLEPYLRRLALKPGENPLYPDGWSCSIIDDHYATQSWGTKEQRIVEIVESFTSQHRVVIDEEVARNKDFQHQYTRLRPEKNCLGFSPNEMDALAGCFLAWRMELSLDPDKQLERLTRDDTVMEFDKITDFLLGRGRKKKPSVNWLKTV